MMSHNFGRFCLELLLRLSWVVALMAHTEAKSAATVVVDDFFGTKVADPHRWLEDLDSARTQKLVNSHRMKTADFLNNFPSRSAIQQQMEDVWNFQRHWAPMKIQNCYFSFKNSRLQHQNVMYVQESLQGPTKIFFDPNTLSPDGTTALDTFAFSGDGQIFAFSLQQKGQDWKTVKFMNAITGADLPDVSENSKWSNLLWSPDNKGVFYARFPFRERGNLKQQTFNVKLYYHRIGTRQAEDILIAEFPDMPDLKIHKLSLAVTTCQNYLVISGSRNYNTSALYIASLKDGTNEKLKSRVIQIFPDDALYEFITNTGASFLIRTNRDAPQRKLVTVVIDLHAVDTESALTDGVVLQWSTFLAEQENRVLDLVTPVGSDQLLLRYIQDFRHALELRSVKDASLLHVFSLPTEGSVTDFSSGSLGDSDNMTDLFVSKNSFDDFERAAEFLITNKYTTPLKLVIQGMSNGGLLVGACVNQRPELYGAAISQHGVMDILRFQHFTVGYTWCSENGCSNNQTYFPTLFRYSPLHNIRILRERTVQYPAILVTTGDHDYRVVPLHSYKYMAELERVIGGNPNQTNPTLLRVDTNIGHQDGQPNYKRINEAVDIQTFITATLKLEFVG